MPHQMSARRLETKPASRKRSQCRGLNHNRLRHSRAVPAQHTEAWAGCERPIASHHFSPRYQIGNIQTGNGKLRLQSSRSLGAVCRSIFSANLEHGRNHPVAKLTARRKKFFAHRYSRGASRESLVCGNAAQNHREQANSSGPDWQQPFHEKLRRATEFNETGHIGRR